MIPRLDPNRVPIYIGPMNPRILLTGFGPFPGADTNPTEKLMGVFTASSEKWFPEAEVRTAVLTTAYAECERGFMSEIKRFEPDIVLSFGVSGRADALFLERFALNMDDADLPDVRGEVRKGRTILAEGPPALTASLDLEGMYQKLTQAGVPVRFSNHAGTYVCNHLFYFGLYHLARQKRRTRMGFVHIPPVAEWERRGSAEIQSSIREGDLVWAARALVSAAAKPTSPEK